MMILFMGACEKAEKESLEPSELNRDEITEVSEIYTFKLDGITYSLPCKVSDFIDNGWELGTEAAEFEKTKAAGTDSLVLFKKKNNNLIQLLIRVYACNKGVELQDLYVGEISVNEGQGIDIDLHGFTIGSDAEEAGTYYANKAVQTKENTDTNKRICKKYYFTEDNIMLMEDTYEYMEFVIEPDTQKVFQIILSYYPLM